MKVHVDFAEVLRRLDETNRLLHEVLAELRRVPTWSEVRAANHLAADRRTEGERGE